MPSFTRKLPLVVVVLCSVMAGCVSDDYRSDDDIRYYRDIDRRSERYDRDREQARQWEAKRDEYERRRDNAIQEDRNHRKFCRGAPSSVFCRYD